jgi:hypothetical protein
MSEKSNKNAEKPGLVDSIFHRGEHKKDESPKSELPQKKKKSGSGEAAKHQHKKFDKFKKGN